MKKINLVKYGFVRWPEEDFSDDGNHFICFRAGKAVRVSKLVAKGQAYLSISSDVGRDTLPYEVYSKLPHYRDAEWRWNGVSVEDLTDNDLWDFYTACVEYEKEYLEAEAALEYPSIEALKEKTLEIRKLRETELKVLETLLSDHVTEVACAVSKWEWTNLQDYLKNLRAEIDRLDPDTLPKTKYKTKNSLDFVKPEYGVKSSYYYEYCFELINRACKVLD